MKVTHKIICFFFGFLGYGAFGQSLEEYLQIAAENNPGVKAAYAEFQAALQQAPQVSSLPDPNLTVSAFGRMVETRLGPQEARFSLMQMFPWFGTLSAKKDAAVLMAEAKFQEYLDLRNELFFDVSEQYYRIYELEKQIRFQLENISILQNYKDLALAQVRSGDGAMADVLQADLLVNETRTTTEILEMQRIPLIAQFSALLNRGEDLEVVIPENLNQEVEFHEPLFEIVSLADHPRIRQIEKRIAASKAQEEIAKKEGMPNLGLGVDYVIIGERTDMNRVDNGKDALMPMVSLSLPIFRKKYRAARKEAQLMQESYSQRQIEVANELTAEYESVLFDLEKSRRMLELYERQIETTQQILDLQLSSYRNAGVDFEEVLRLRQELLRYQYAIAGAEMQFFTAVARKNYLTGNSFNYENGE